MLAVTPTGHPSEALYLERALAVAEGTRGFRFRSLGGGAFSALDPKALEPVGVIAVLSTRGRRAARPRAAGRIRSWRRRAARRGGPDVDPAILKDALAGIVETSWATRAGRAVVVRAGRQPPPGVPCVRRRRDTGQRRLFAGRPDYRARQRPASLRAIQTAAPRSSKNEPPGGRVLVFGSDLNYRWNDFPLQPAFVPFIHETVRYLASPRTSRTEYLVGDLPGEQRRQALSRCRGAALR